MYKTKSFVIGAALLILALVPGLACGAKPAEAPPSPPPVTEPVPPVQETLPQLSEEEPPSLPATDIPANYTTYIDESKLFSISYPSDWETALSIVGAVEQKVKETINNLKTGISIEEASTIFLAGRRMAAGGYLPNMNIGVEPVPAGISTHDGMLEAEVRGLKMVLSDYREMSRIKTTIDGREATILSWEGAPPQLGKMRFLQMFTMVDETIWIVTCTAAIDDFAEWENDFDNIVRSLRISD